MSQQPLDQLERERLCDLMLEAGADAPTLCEGWDVADLAAHLIVRERDPRSAPGILFGGRFEAYTQRLMERQKAKGLPAMVERIRSGPPLYMRIPKLRTLVNLTEYFVHHEDVRRPQGMAPRTDAELDAAFADLLPRSSKLQTMRLRGAGLDVELPGATRFTARKARDGENTAVLQGPPGEVVLYLYGRKEAAQVTLDGPADAVEVVEQATFGI